MRILAGEYKGRRLLPPPGRAQTRPITSSVKKSLFDMLGARLIDAVVVDLYCGTGTIGLEALSRGAARCYFAERDRAVLDRLRRNIDTVGAGDRSGIWAGDAARGLAGRLAGVDGAVDLAFVDPPYAQARRWSWDRVGRSVFAPLAEHLADDGLVVLRLPGQVECPATIKGLEIVRERKYGDMALVMLGREDQ